MLMQSLKQMVESAKGMTMVVRYPNSGSVHVRLVASNGINRGYHYVDLPTPFISIFKVNTNHHNFHSTYDVTECSNIVKYMYKNKNGGPDVDPNAKDSFAQSSGSPSNY